MKIYCITWKDERWSADKESLKAINKMINKNIKVKKNFLNRISPESILSYFMYFVGFIYHGSISFLKWVINKLKRNK
tara:strand:- start:2345 stop:2575 length:231 start_codon:yes stop_codon:yes gene_type:complete